MIGHLPAEFLSAGYLEFLSMLDKIKMLLSCLYIRMPNTGAGNDAETEQHEC